MNISVLLGKTLVKCERTNNHHNDEITFVTTDGEKFVMLHNQDCCESVTIDDIAGNLNDLVGSPIIKAEESSNSGGTTSCGESSTWTFYHLATINGYVTIKWYGISNGYYSESVDFMREDKDGLLQYN